MYRDSVPAAGLTLSAATAAAGTGREIAIAAGAAATGVDGAASIGALAAIMAGEGEGAIGAMRAWSGAVVGVTLYAQADNTPAITLGIPKRIMVSISCPPGMWLRRSKRRARI